jgi:hypothetical protein
MVSSGMLRRVALLRTDVSEELSASFISVTRIGELGTTLAVTSNRRTQCTFKGTPEKGDPLPRIRCNKVFSYTRHSLSSAPESYCISEISGAT